MKNIKVLLVIIMVVLVSGCKEKEGDMDSNFNILEYDHQNIFLDELSVSFNGLEDSGLIASSILNKTKENQKGTINKNFR